MRIYNTLTQSLEELTATDNKLKMFVCGPTVYDRIHAGNARTFVVFDVVAKYLRHRGFEVDYIQNITDVDDKVIKRAQEQSIEPLVFARDYEEKFKEDMKAIGVDSPRYERATDYIPQIVQQVKTLIDKGNAYFIEEDGWYFDLKTFPEYGKLSKRTAQMADDGVSRIDENSNKRNAGDFCLWKLSKPSEPVWESALGAGRPGWHIEDTAITEANFGPQYDIHGGGRDLVFPHHEAELTQMESISGKSPFVRYWMHAGFLENKSEKMSKSIGNFTKLTELLKSCSKEVLRFFFLSAHYRNPLGFSEEGILMSKTGIDNLKNVIERADFLYVKDVLRKGEKFVKRFDQYWQKIQDALDEDFNTPEAFGILSGFISELNQAIDGESLDSDSYAKAKQILDSINKIFGIVPEIYIPLPEMVERLIKEREILRQNGDWVGADKLRLEIEQLGFSIDDTPYGPLIKQTR